MFEERTNAGLLFNQLPKLALTASMTRASESNLLVKIARLIKNDPNITHDHQFFRQLRSEGMDIDKFASYFGQEYVSPVLEDISERDPVHLSAWFQVQQTVKGFKKTFDPTNELASYWLFLESHTELERCFIEEHYGTDCLEQISDYLRDWLLVESFSLDKPTKQQTTQYLIHMVMYWGALYELFLEEYCESVEHSILKKCLPSIDRKKEFVNSTGAFVNNFKAGWAKEQYSKDDIMRTKLLRDILRAQAQDPNLAGSLHGMSTYDDIDPDLTAIQKRFLRWRKGDFLSIEDVRRYFAILRASYEQTEDYLTLDIIIFINLFTRIQRELLSNGSSEQTIVDTFARYTEIKSLVERRYNSFKCTGNLTS